MPDLHAQSRKKPSGFLFFFLSSNFHSSAFFWQIIGLSASLGQHWPEVNQIDMFLRVVRFYVSCPPSSFLFPPPRTSSESERCGPRRTSNSESLSAVGLAGPQPDLNQTSTGPQRPETKPYRMPERMSENMPDRMSEDMPDRMSENMTH